MSCPWVDHVELKLTPERWPVAIGFVECLHPGGDDCMLIATCRKCKRELEIPATPREVADFYVASQLRPGSVIGPAEHREATPFRAWLPKALEREGLDVEWIGDGRWRVVVARYDDITQPGIGG